MHFFHVFYLNFAGRMDSELVYQRYRSLRKKTVYKEILGQFSGKE